MKKFYETHFLRYLLYYGCLEPNLQYPRGIPTEVLIFWPSDERANSLEKTMMLERLKAGGEGDNRGQNGWMASLT